MTFIPIFNNDMEIKLIRSQNLSVCAIIIFILAGCSMGSLLTNNSEQSSNKTTEFNKNPNNQSATTSGRILDLLSSSEDSETVFKVNRYIWKASLEVLNFLPIEGVDPFQVS